MQAQGFVRFRIQSGTHDAKIYEIDDLPKLKKTEKHTIDVVIDRVKVNAEIKQRLAESRSKPHCAWPTAAPWPGDGWSGGTRLLQQVRLQRLRLLAARVGTAPVLVQ